MASRSAAVAARYRAAQQAQSDRVRATVRRVYDAEFDPNDIPASADRTRRKLAATLSAEQRVAQSTARGFVRASSLAAADMAIEPLAPADVVGTTRGGMSLMDGMAAIGPMMLDTIGKGGSIDDARTHGAFLFERFGTAEVIGAADREQAHQEERPEIVGWEGVISDDACDNCQDNAGPHDLDEDMHRHGNCTCTRLPLWSGPAPTSNAQVAEFTERVLAEQPPITDPIPLAEAEDALRGMGFGTVNLTGIDERLTGEVVATFDELATRYPDVWSHYGSSRIISIGGTGRALADIVARGNTMAVRLGPDWTDAAKLAEVVAADHVKGWLADSTIRSVIVHEFGHAVQRSGIGQRAWMEAARKARGTADKLSMYAASRNTEEWFAEAFARLYADPNAKFPGADELREALANRTIKPAPPREVIRL